MPGNQTTAVRANGGGKVAYVDNGVFDDLDSALHGRLLSLVSEPRRNIVKSVGLADDDTSASLQKHDSSK